jgi:hypothetical protein
VLAQIVVRYVDLSKSYSDFQASLPTGWEYGGWEGSTFVLRTAANGKKVKESTSNESSMFFNGPKRHFETAKRVLETHFQQLKSEKIVKSFSIQGCKDAYDLID